jgi:hypothetical protein
VNATITPENADSIWSCTSYQEKHREVCALTADMTQQADIAIIAEKVSIATQPNQLHTRKLVNVSIILFEA